MANPAAEARARVLAAHPEAVVVERGRNSIKHRLFDAPDSRRRYALDCAIGPLHYGPDADWEIDTAFQPSTAPWQWEMSHAGFEVRALSRLDTGQVIEYRDGETEEWVRFQPHALQYSNALDQIQPIAMPGAVEAEVDDDTLTWPDGYGPGVSISWQAQTARLAKRLTIQSPDALPPVEQYVLDGGEPCLELNFIFAFSAGVTPYINGEPWDKKGERETQGLVEFRDGDGNVLWWFNLPRSWDSSGDPESGQQLGTFRFKRQGNSLFVSHRVPLAFVQGAAYPLVVDVDVDEQVGSGDDDAEEKDDDTAFSRSEAYPKIYSHAATGSRYNCGLRFTTVTIAQGLTIGTATLEIWATVGAKDCNADILAEDVDDADDFAATEDVTSRTRTSASVAWAEDGLSSAGFNSSPEIKTVIQEVISREGWVSDNDLVVFMDGRSDASKGLAIWGYLGLSTRAAKLHIEYEEAGGVAHEGSASLSGAGTLSCIAAVALVAAAALSGIGSLSAAGEITGRVEGEASLSGQGTLTAAGVVEAVGAASLSGQGSLAASGLRERIAGASLTGEGSLSAGAVKGLHGAASLSGEGGLMSKATVSYAAVASLSGEGVLTVKSVVLYASAASLSGEGTLTADGRVVIPGETKYGAAALSGAGTLAASAIVFAIPITDLAASYEPILALAASYKPVLALAASYKPIIELEASVA